MECVSETCSVMISIILPSYNHGDFIEEAIESVLQQTYQNYEFLVSDDGSSDQTVEILAKYVSRFPVGTYQYTIQKKRLGPVGNINFLIHQARGRYVAVLNSDDYWHRDKLRLQLEHLEKQKNAVACFTWASVVSEKMYNMISTTAFNVKNASQAEFLKKLWADGNFFCHPSLLILRDVYHKIGYYNSAFRQLPDYELWVRLLKYAPVTILEQPLVYYRRTANNTSTISRENRIREITEYAEIYSSFFKGMPADLFHDAFQKKIRKDVVRDATPDVLLAKSFYLLLSESAYCEIAAKEAAIRLLFQESYNLEFEKILQDEYNISIFDQYQLTAQYGTGALFAEYFPANKKAFWAKCKIRFADTLCLKLLRMLRIQVSGLFFGRR
ncbi:putative Glycosyl transferase family protein [uncultured Sporomusa sp.]|uniref:Putative Glycosyl transferase family protein n=1 Tax=uncultured Sporomusa sp. TaxID=307249 RepID=A0A212M1E3_9FIRM|nr:glycosyltransferase [uncultured Sporomusa sp.]SCM83633.1 putative Glycosyl transferase family protein [uncultured Sporomusa sp.]